MLRRLMKREDGLAMIVALLVTFVVLLLSVVVLQQSIHNVGTSAYDRERLTAVSAAEAGLDYFYNRMENANATSLPGTLTGSVGSGPSSVSYTVTPTYYANSTGTIAFTGTPSASNFPLSVYMRSVGTATDGSSRVMETFAALTAIYGGVNGAMITNHDLSLTNNFTLNGNNGNDGDLIINSGNFTAPSGVESIRGSIYVHAGTASFGTNAHLYGTLWANGSLTVNHSQAQVDGDVKSTTSSVTVSAGTVSGGASYCTGSAPSNVTGTKVQTCSLGAPPSQSIPLIQYNQTAWASFGYGEKTFTGASACTDARTWIEGTGANTYDSGTTSNWGTLTHASSTGTTTGVVVLTPNTCQYTASNNANVTMKTDLALLAYGGIDLGNNSSWTGSGGTRNLFFMSPYNGVASRCSPTYNPSQNITVQNLNTFTSVRVSVYTPCTASVSNNSGFVGQVIGDTISVSNKMTLNYYPVLIPGTDITGYKQDVAYIREVSS